MVRLLLLSCMLLGGVVPLGAQEPPAQPASEIGVAALQARVDAIQADAAMSAEAKAPLLAVLGRALETARATETRQQALQRYAGQRASVGERLAQRRGELQALDGKKPGPTRQDLGLAEIEQGVGATQQAHTDAQKAAADVETERARRAERRIAIPALIADHRARLDALPTQPPDVAGVEPRLANARRLALLAERARQQAEIDVLVAEVQTYDAEVELLRTESDLAARRAMAAKADVDAWLEVLHPARAAAAQRAEEEARQTALRADPRLAKLADGNAALARAVATLVEKRQRAEGDKSRREQERLRLQQDFEEVRKRTELVGPTDAVGALLRQRRTRLAVTSRQYQHETRSCADRIADAQLQNLDFDEQRRRLAEDPDAWLQQQVGGEGAAPEVFIEARRLREARRGVLQQLVDGYAHLLGTEIDVQSAQHEIANTIENYRAYVAQRVLGIRSSAPIWQLDWVAAAAGVAWLFDPVGWGEVGRALFLGLVGDVWPLALALPLLALLALRRLLARRLLLNSDRAVRGSNVDYAPTARAAIDTLALALPVPALLWLCGWRLAARPECTDFGKAIASGLEQTSWALFLVLALRAIVRRRGLAEVHFQWQSTTVAQLRWATPLMLLAALPFSFLLAVLEVPGDDRLIGSLGGLLLLGQLVLLLLVFGRLLHPTTGLIGGSVRASSGALLRFRRLWYLLGVGTPLTLLLMVMLGYDYTALQLARRLHLTVAVLATGGFVHAMIVRGLVLARRRLQIRRAQERMQAAKAGEAGAGAAEGPALEEVDPQSLARQTQTLLRGAITIVVAVMAFQIWGDVLPALGALRTVVLWQGGSALDPDIVTLADLLWGLFLLLASLAAARNLPALLELFVLQRLSMQAGERHAMSTLARYGIVIVGTIWSFSAIGIGWSKVQWAVAAVSVGLGFGLQEIFANFVSGLILLFERPIRVGDIVQVGTTTGRVTRIRIRATIIQDWERKELVVPNREFVSKQFVNWTLSDPIVRFTLPVSVAFGSDSEKALRLLEQVARASRSVLADPRPEGVFVAFGDNTLNLELRVHVDISALDYRWMTELYQAIGQAFRAADLNIAFPQRDVNLKVSEQALRLMQQRVDVG